MITESSTRRIGEVDVIDISGRLSLGNTLMALERSIQNLIEQGSRKLVVNLAKLDFIDSAGVGTLIACNGQMEQKQGKMRIAGAQGAVARTFELVHMGRIVALDGDLDSACNNLA